MQGVLIRNGGIATKAGSLVTNASSSCSCCAISGCGTWTVNVNAGCPGCVGAQGSYSSGGPVVASTTFTPDPAAVCYGFPGSSPSCCNIWTLGSSLTTWTDKACSRRGATAANRMFTNLVTSGGSISLSISMGPWIVGQSAPFSFVPGAVVTVAPSVPPCGATGPFSAPAAGGSYAASGSATVTIEETMSP
jgi:hypothetical protein